MAIILPNRITLRNAATDQVRFLDYVLAQEGALYV